jgi:hypothetical protein
MLESKCTKREFAKGCASSRDDGIDVGFCEDPREEALVTEGGIGVAEMIFVATLGASVRKHKAWTTHAKVACHDIRQIESQRRRNRDGWQLIIGLCIRVVRFVQKRLTLVAHSGCE